jgi:hypothetical protein
MPSDVLVSAPGTETAPLDYLIAPGQEIVLKAAFATFDGSGAGGAFLPTLRVVAPSGQVVGEYVTDSTVAAGASAEVSFFPRGKGAVSTPSPPAAAGVPWCLATDDHSTIGVGHTNFSFSDSFDTSDATLFDTVVSGGLTIVRMKTTGFYRLTCQTNGLETNTVTGLLTSGWTFSPPGRFTGYEFEFGTSMGIAVDDGGNSNWFIASQQVLNVFGAANVTAARFVDSSATGTINTQATSLLIERLSDHV